MPQEESLITAFGFQGREEGYEMKAGQQNGFDPPTAVDYERLKARYAEVKNLAKRQHAFAKQEVKVLKQEREILQNELLWREIQVEWLTKNFPQIKLPPQLLTLQNFENTADPGEFLVSPTLQPSFVSTKILPPLTLSRSQILSVNPVGNTPVKLSLAEKSLPTTVPAQNPKHALQKESQTAPMKKLDATQVMSTFNSVKLTIAETKKRLKRELSDIQTSLSSELLSFLPRLVNASVRRALALEQEETILLRTRWLREVALRRKLHNELQELRGNVRVFCRIRPVPSVSVDCVKVAETGDTLEISQTHTGQRKEFFFDRVFGQSSSNKDVATEIAPFVVSVLDGYPTCVFGYGQTGSGKTHSMAGVQGDPGVYQTSFEEVFRLIAEREESGWHYSEVTVSVLEIYNDELNDLLVKDKDKPLVVKSNGTGFHVPGLTCLPVISAEGVLAAINRGAKNRVVGTHALNAQSSRSHLLIQLRMMITPPSSNDGGKPGSSASSNSSTTPRRILIPSSLTLVDLAGSERLDRTSATGETAKEGIHINKSLSALGDVIHAKAAKASHIPYRNSILTSLLQESLSNDAKTLMLLQVNPALDSFDESCNSMVFGTRVTSVETRDRRASMGTRKLNNI